MYMKKWLWAIALFAALFSAVYFMTRIKANDSQGIFLESVPGDTLCIKKMIVGGLFDTVQTLFKTDLGEGVVFRFLHPEFGNAFWSKEHLARKIIALYGLSHSSSAFDIVTGVADFHKQGKLQVNHELVQNSTSHPSGALSAVGLYSIQCGQFRDKVMNITRLIANLLKCDQISFRNISLGAHEVMEYWDTSLAKWVFLDPDVNTIMLLPKKNGLPVSFEEIVNEPSILLDTTSILIRKHAYDYSLDFARKRYYDFIVPLLPNAFFFTPAHFSDDRDIYYQIPSGAELSFEAVFEQVNLDITVLGDAFLAKCILAFEQNDSLGILSGQRRLAEASQLNLSLLQRTWAQNCVGFGDSLYFGKSDVAWWMKLRLPPGEYTCEDIHVPHLLRSLTPERPGVPYMVGGKTYIDKHFTQVYWPKGSNHLGNPPPLDPAKLQYNPCEISVPEALGSLTLTFYFNHKMFAFWEKDWQIVVLDGKLDIVQELKPCQHGRTTRVLAD